MPQTLAISCPGSLLICLLVLNGNINMEKLTFEISFFSKFRGLLSK